MGHASNLVGNQKADVSFRFHTLPLFAGVRAIAARTTFKLLEGLSAETSGDPPRPPGSPAPPPRARSLHLILP
jgi:hypothetical protein